MPEFLVETFADRSALLPATGLSTLVSRAAEQVSAAGGSVELVSCIAVPDEEMCLLVFEADTIDTVRQATALAGLSSTHIAASRTDVASVDRTEIPTEGEPS